MKRVCGLVLTLAVAVAGLVSGQEKPQPIVVDKEKRTIIIPAKVAPRKIDDPKFKEIYPIEVIAAYPYPRGAKAHETVVTIDVKPSDVHAALESLGLKAGKPALGEKEVATGPEVKLFIETGSGTAVKRTPVEKVLMDRKTEKPMPKVKWVFTGSPTRKAADGGPDVYAADATGTLITVFPVTSETVFMSTLTKQDEKYVKLETNKTLLPPEGTPVRLVIVAPEK